VEDHPMKITDICMAGPYVKVKANTGPGGTKRAVYYIRKELWVTLDSKIDFEYELQMLQYSDFAIDPEANVFTKCRYDYVSLIDILVNSEE
jgi:hypothetical protein